jgi:hypothetical protein
MSTAGVIRSSHLPFGFPVTDPRISEFIYDDSVSADEWAKRAHYQKLALELSALATAEAGEKHRKWLVYDSIAKNASLADGAIDVTGIPTPQHSEFDGKSDDERVMAIIRYANRIGHTDTTGQVIKYKLADYHGTMRLNASSQIRAEGGVTHWYVFTMRRMIVDTDDGPVEHVSINKLST